MQIKFAFALLRSPWSKGYTILLGSLSSKVNAQNKQCLFSIFPGFVLPFSIFLRLSLRKRNLLQSAFFFLHYRRSRNLFSLLLHYFAVFCIILQSFAIFSNILLSFVEMCCPPILSCQRSLF